MPVRQRRNGWSYVAAISWRGAAQRYSFVLFLILACGLMVFEHGNPIAMQSARGRLVDSMIPLLNAASRPFDLVDQFSKRVNSYAQLQVENEKLRVQNRQLVQWQNAVVALEHENKELKGLLRFKAEPNLAYISARVVADTGGPFVRSLVVTAGRVEGVREGMAAVTGEGLVGRIVEVGENSSRVLMITDLNSRLPVTVAGGGEHAILAGDNSAQLKLMYLPQDASVQHGARVLTSGHGGVFPPNLPVGTVVNNGRGSYYVAPLAPLGRISYITLIDFNLVGGSSNVVAAKIATDSKR